MHTALLAGSAVLLAVGIASAQAADTSASQTNPSTSSSSTTTGQMQSGNMSIKQNIQDALTKQGYTDISVTPSSFMVRAKTAKGDPVAMVIGPDSVTEVTEIPQTDGNNANNMNTNKTDSNQNNTTPKK